MSVEQLPFGDFEKGYKGRNYFFNAYLCRFKKPSLHKRAKKI